MPQGKGTYGSKVGRPRKKKGLGGGFLSPIIKQVYERVGYPPTTDSTMNGDTTTFQMETLLPRYPNLQNRTMLENRTMFAEGGKPSMEDQMDSLAMSVQPVTVEEEQLPDEEMEEDYVDYIVNSTLSEEDKNYLESALIEDAKLSQIFDQVVENASEFSGAGPINGPGSEVSDSIPARLSDGEFVFTAKAADEIGADVLQQQMEDAEASVDERQDVAYGGVIDEDKKADIAVSTQGSILAAGGVPPVVPINPIREEQLLSMQSSSPRRGYRTISG